MENPYRSCKLTRVRSRRSEAGIITTSADVPKSKCKLVRAPHNMDCPPKIWP